MRYSVIIAMLGFIGVVACQKAPEYHKFKTDAEVPRIELVDAKAAYDAGNVVVIDSRPEDAYKQEHITGAINIPLGSLDDKFDAIPKDKKIIVYCS